MSMVTTAFNAGLGLYNGFYWFEYMGSLSDRYAKFWLAVQQEAESRGYTNATVAGLAYLNYRDAPVSMAGPVE